uniref:Docking protein 2 n=1 Tax=Pavo cristatus TaxID=9049 RepID=A0A8C9L2Y8_PAVCR
MGGTTALWEPGLSPYSFLAEEPGGWLGVGRGPCLWVSSALPAAQRAEMAFGCFSCAVVWLGWASPQVLSAGRCFPSGAEPCSRVQTSPPPPPSPGVEHDFEVTLRATESSERCRLRGRFVLRAGEEALELRDVQSREVLYSWPYRFLRRFGRDKVTFSFEAGRRCTSGEGNFEFETRQGNEIFQVIESAIAVQRERGGPGDEGTRPRQQTQPPERAQEHEEHRAKSIYTEPCGPLIHSTPSAVPKAPEKGLRKDAVGELEYAVPFDTIAKSLMVGKFGSILQGPADAPDPLYDSIQEAGGHPPLPRAKPEHIYDEPEGVRAHTVYDEPQEVKGEAWRLQAAPEEPSGHEYPYNPQRDDYAVPKRAVPARGARPHLQRCTSGQLRPLEGTARPRCGVGTAGLGSGARCAPEPG